MSVLPFNTTSNTSVPDNTIRKTWDKYLNSGFNASVSNHNRLHLNGNCYKSKYPNDFSSGKVPIGAWVKLWDSNGCHGF